MTSILSGVRVIGKGVSLEGVAEGRAPDWGVAIGVLVELLWVAIGLAVASLKKAAMVGVG